MDFKDKVAIVTGATRGIGRVISREFAQRDCQLVLNGTNVDLLEEVASEIRRDFGVGVLTVAGDVSLHETVKKIFSEALARFSKVDFLINNAGIVRDNITMRMKEGEWDEVLRVNLKSVFLMSKEALRPMLKNRFGRIVNISSIVGETGGAGQLNYSASKGGVIAMTKSLAREMGAKNICVNAVAPGFIKTDMTDALNSERQEEIQKSIILNRLGKPEDIANGVMFLCSDLSSYITGQVLSVNGGLYM